MRTTNAKSALQKFHVTAARGGAPTLVHVMDDEENFCYHVPAVAAQVPATLQCAVKLRLCRNMAATGHCDFGAKCMYVHVRPDVLKHCEKSQVHTNFAWKTLEEVPYERHAAGGEFIVQKPKDRKPGDAPSVIPSENVIVTRGSQDYETRATMMFNLSLNSATAVETKVQPATVCAHYFINRSCRLGRTCQFIHVANVDESASQGKKAKKRASLPTSCTPSEAGLLSPRSTGLLSPREAHMLSPSPSEALRFSPSADFLSDSGNSDTQSNSTSPRACSSTTKVPVGHYVHNPYPTMSLHALGFFEY